MITLPDGQFIFLQFAINSCIYVLFVFIRKESFRIVEALLIILLISLTTTILLTITASINLTSILSNIASIFIITFIANKKRNLLPLTAVYAFFAIIIMLLTASITSLLLDVAHHILIIHIPTTVEALSDDLLFSILYLIISFAIGFFIARRLGVALQNKVSLHNESNQIKLSKALLFVSIITILFFFTFMHVRYIFYDPAIVTLIYTVVIGVGFGGMVFTLFIFSDNIHIAGELRHKDELLQSIQEYTERQDMVTTELKQFRHDHINLLTGFRGFISKNNMDGLQGYLDKYLAGFIPIARAADAIHDKLSNIQALPLRGLLQAKCIQAQKMGVTVWIEVNGKPVLSDTYMFDVNRIIGIFMDNALEACRNVKDAEVRVLVAPKENGTFIIIENTCHNPPSLNDMLSGNPFSTKGAGRGLGLVKVWQILAQNKNITLKTNIKDNLFIHELYVV
ncbi:MAG: GHKL domain-containing protein [Defluviitaleaceae bacterium]|nr:GHKL domain-containing protein [Defluviitaleaceae bacterium]